MERRGAGYDLFLQARGAVERGDPTDAVRLFAASAHLTPHFKTFELWGECMLRLEDSALAVKPLEIASSLNRGPRAPVLLARAFLMLGELETARRWIEESLARHPGYGPAVDVRKELPR